MSTSDTHAIPYPPPPRIHVRILRVVAWNLGLTIAGLVVIAAVGEIAVRLLTPFYRNVQPIRFVPGVGVIHEPGAESRWTNHQDFWTISRVNSLGFLDREPISPERAAESCHITIIGDSFVDAREVPIADKIQVQLEELAAQELPELDVTTSAFGFRGTAQVNQLPFYDHYAQRLRPKLTALVFVRNDFLGNSPVLNFRTWDPDHAPYAFGGRDTDGTMRLRLPDPRWMEFLPPSNKTWVARGLDFLRWSEFAAWLQRKMPPRITRSEKYTHAKWLETLSRRPGYEHILDGWNPHVWPDMLWPDRFNILFEDDPPQVLREGIKSIEFALRQFRERTDRDGGSLVILSTYTMEGSDSRYSIRLNEIAGRFGIPVINEYDYIVRQGRKVTDARFLRDGHWNATGHQWAAEALLEYLKQNQEICDTMDPVDAERTLS